MITQLRAYLAQAALPEDGRLPPERGSVGGAWGHADRTRKALGTLEAEGQIWRHVGKGTFIGSRPIDTFADIAALAKRTNPAEVMRARLIMEPEIARAAALTATPMHLAEMRMCQARTREAGTWRQYENWDNACTAPLRRRRRTRPSGRPVRYA